VALQRGAFMIFLDSKRIYLRGLEPSDVEGEYLTWLNSQEINRYNSHGRFAYSKEQALEYIKSSYSDSSKLVLAIINKADERHIGNISLQAIDYINRSAELAIMLSVSQKGIGYEASKVLIEHGFQSLNLHRIYCGTSSENIAMQKLALKLGMQQEGVRKEALFKDGRYVDILEYGLINFF